MEAAKKVQDSFQMRLIQEEKDRLSLSQLLNHAFQVPKGAEFFDDFPVWDARFFPHAAIVGAFKDHELASCAGVRVVEVSGDQKPFLAAIVGAVATDSKFQGNGLASVLVAQAVKAAETQKADIVFLWGSKHDLYRRMGFELCGLQVRVSADLLGQPDLLSESEVQQGWTSGIFERLKKRKQGILIKPGDETWLQAHKNVKWYWLGDPLSPTAYVGYERGIDLQGIIHEWGGNVDEVLKLVRFLHQQNPSVELLASPFQLQSYGIPFDERKLEFLCMAKVLNPKSVFASFYPDVDLQCEKTDEGWNLTLGDQVLTGLTSGQLSMLFFGPEQLEGIWAQYFPLPLWFWGLDAA